MKWIEQANPFVAGGISRYRIIRETKTQYVCEHNVRFHKPKNDERGALLRYDVRDLQETLDRVTHKSTRKSPRKTSEYAHPFSCEGLGQWD